jgi:hypothetical protein
MSKKPSKYNISEDEAAKFKFIIQSFEKSSIETEKLFDLFTEWQSLKTRSLKRFVLTLSFLLTLAFFIEMDISVIEPLGLSVEDANQTAFLISLMIIHVTMLPYYFYQRSVDLNVKKAKVLHFSEDLEEFLDSSEKIEEFMNEKSIPSFRVLIKEVTGNITFTKSSRKSQQVYEAVSFFKEKLKKEKAKSDLAEKAEAIIIVGLWVFGIITVVSSF